MQRGTKRFRRAGAAALAALTATVGLATVAGTATAAPGFVFTRLAGADRYETARITAESKFNNTDTVLLATGENFADALAGNYLAGNLGAPILLTPTAGLVAATRTGLTNLRARNVIILGGTAAVSAAVEAELRTITSSAVGGGLLTVNRIAGGDRYETARLIATAPGTAIGAVGGNRTAFVTTGDNFADALAAGPGSFANKIPIIITETAALNANARQALDDLNVQRAVILGGTAAVSAATETAVQGADQNPPVVPAATITTTRLQGGDRTETARAIADYEVVTLGFTRNHVNLARGDFYPDALVGGTHGGREVTPILLTASPTVLSNTPDTGARRYILDNAATLTSGDIFGGTEAVSAAVQTEATTVAQGSITGPITLNATSVAQGALLGGFVSEPGNVVSLTVSGCGLSNQALTFSATTGAFSVPIPASQVAGACTLTFVVQRTIGVSVTQAIAITVTAATAARTNAPDLVSATASGATVTYLFDEPPVGFPPVLTNFHLYSNLGVRSNPSAVAVIGNSVVATFTTATVAAGTTATIEQGAVVDAGGLPSPRSAVPLTGFNQAPGITTGPDLVSVGNFGTTPFGTRTADFVFDEAVAPAVFTPGVTPPTFGPGAFPSEAGFELIFSDNTFVRGTVGSAVIATADGRTVTVTFVAGPVIIPVSQIVRGAVEAGTVLDTSTPAVPNVLQIAEVQTGGITSGPDLLTAEITGLNQVTYTFDEPVDPGPPGGPNAPIAALFFVYNAAAATFSPATVARSATDARVVVATFAPGIVAGAVGASVEGVAGAGLSAVCATTGLPIQCNIDDEVPLQNINLAAGRTALPDLVSVAITTNAFLNPVVTFTFDQLLPPGYAPALFDFALHDADGIFLFPVAPAAVIGAAGSTTVTFTFTGPTGFLPADAAAAVLGSVKHTASGTAAPGAPAPIFPEGSAPVSR